MAAASPPQDQQQPTAEGAVALEDPAALPPRRAWFPHAWRLHGMWELASVLNFLHVSALAVVLRVAPTPAAASM